jgi:serine/threonine protein kinase
MPFNLQFNSAKYRKVKHALHCGGTVPKISDFGMARHIGHNQSHMSNVKQGTPFYMAPEVFKDQRMSPASDVYAFGIMMWEVMMGRSIYICKCVLSLCRTLSGRCVALSINALSSNG